MNRKQKIYDCFMFNGENHILEIRFNLLDKYVDYFVIVESNISHSGVRKKNLFKINKYKKFKKKIRYILVKDMPKNPKGFHYNKMWWHKNHERDQHQRRQILKGLDDAKPHDIILVSDVDEIPNLKKINFKKINKLVVCEQLNLRYKFNLICGYEPIWQGTRILKRKYLKDVQSVRNTYKKKCKPWQLVKMLLNPTTIKNCGWHFSWVLSPQNIKKKIENSAHGELNKKKFKNINSIKQKLKNKVDPLFDYKLIELKNYKLLPNFLLKKKFDNFFYR